MNGGTEAGSTANGWMDWIDHVSLPYDCHICSAALSCTVRTVLVREGVVEQSTGASYSTSRARFLEEGE